MTLADVAPPPVAPPDRPAGPVAVAGAVLMGLVGLALVVVGGQISVLLPAAAALGLLALPHLLTRPTFALAAVVGVELSNAGVVLGDHGVPGTGTAMLAIGVAATVLAVRRGTARITWSPIYTALVIFLAVRAVTVLLGADPGRAMNHIGDVARAVVFLVVITTLASAAGGIRTLLWTSVVVAAGLAGMSIVQEFVIGNGFDFFGFSNVPLAGDLGASTARHSGPQSDANFWARTLVLFPPLALALWSSAHDRRAQAFWLGAALSIVGGIYLTQSRGGLITVGVAAVFWMVVAGPRSRRLLLLAPTAIVLLTLVPGVGSRLATLASIGQASSEGGDPSLVGRVAVQEQGFEMFLDHPATGVGAASFTVAEEEYERESGLTKSNILAAHNLYLEMAAEGGVAGLASWLLLYGTACWLPLRAWLLRARVRSSDRLLEHALPAGVLASLAGWAIASVFLHLAGLRLLFVVVAIGAALDNRARRLATSAQPRPPARQTRTVRWRTVAAAGVGSLALVAGTAWAGVTTEWRASAQAVLLTPTAGEDAYDLDIATRPFVRQSIAAALDLTARDVDVVPSATSAIVTLQARAGTAEGAERRAREVLERGAAAVSEIEPLLTFDPVEGEIEARHVRTLSAGGLSAVLLVVMLLSWGAVASGWIRRRLATATP